MKIIVRVENDYDGNGFFCSRNPCDTDTCVFTAFSFTNDLDRKHKDFPGPFRDGLFRQENDFCAFKSIEDLQKWIKPEWFEEIFSFGFKVWLIAVSKYEEGIFQIIFKKEDILHKEDISALFISEKINKEYIIDDDIDF